jgi:hypothetical protein
MPHSRGPAKRARLAGFRRVSTGFCQPIVNRAIVKRAISHCGARSRRRRSLIHTRVGVPGSQHRPGRRESRSMSSARRPVGLPSAWLVRELPGMAMARSAAQRPSRRTAGCRRSSVVRRSNIRIPSEVGAVGDGGGGWLAGAISRRSAVMATGWPRPRRSSPTPDAGTQARPQRSFSSRRLAPPPRPSRPAVWRAWPLRRRPSSVRSSGPPGRHRSARGAAWPPRRSGS